MPPGLVTDAPNYLAFLQKLQGVMPQGKTISIAAPASYWYLKQFPIGDIAKVVDYIVYMTYDLHGRFLKCIYLYRILLIEYRSMGLR